ncbi:MAG: hypothetical protein K5654_01155 [Lachnospiraceae bacterium]|nr:hypothetical protein [Lachnospiraceae bacterium]
MKKKVHNRTKFGLKSVWAINGAEEDVHLFSEIYESVKEIGVDTTNYNIYLCLRGSIDLKGGFYYFIYIPRDCENTDGVVYYQRYTLWDFEPYKKPNGDPEGLVKLELRDVHVRRMGYATGTFAAVSDRKLYIRAFDQSKIYVINLDDPSDVKEVKDVIHSPSQNYNHIASLPRGGAITNQRQIIYPDGKAVTNGVSINWEPGENSTFMHCPGFLGTICNLPEPVTKTADKIMKITYTLTEV